jgi:hypothetical protein
MNTNERIAEEVERTLQAFDADRPLQVNPFLTTRIDAELQRRGRIRRIAVVSFFQLKYIVVLILFAVNVVTIVHYSQRSTEQDVAAALMSQLEVAFDIDQDQNNF